MKVKRHSVNFGEVGDASLQSHGAQQEYFPTNVSLGDCVVVHT